MDDPQNERWPVALELGSAGDKFIEPNFTEAPYIHYVRY